MNVKQLSIKDFTYELPDEKIARHPLTQRDESKLLVYKSGNLTETIFQSLDEVLPENSILVFNNTKVVEARLLFTKPSGGVIELFCLEPSDDYGDITTAMLQKGSVQWKCFVGGAKKWKDPFLVKPLMVNGKSVSLKAKIEQVLSDCYLIAFSWDDTTLSFAEVLHYGGLIPLPPYLKREVEENDKNSYQTIYAHHDGSVAAPTAGLHFTPNVFNKLVNKGIEKIFVTLHVGAGTFKPVKAERMEDHEMHAEFIDVPIDTIIALNNTLAGNIIAVGTTSLRTIESLYWMGVKISATASLDAASIALNQWDAYTLPQNITSSVALTTLIHWMEQHQLSRLITKTQIIIAPGYKLKIASGIITNFHQPQSTLLLLIASMIGEDWRKVYDYALTHDFRFLSYGDSSLLLKR